MRSKSVVFRSSVIGISFCSAPLRSVGLGLVGEFELATRILAASLRPRPGRAERKRTDPDKLSLPGDASQGGAADACCTPSPLGLAGALEVAARTRSASLGRSTGQSRTKTKRTRQARLSRRLEPAPEPQQARKVPLEPAAVRCVRFLRSKSAVFCSSVIGLHFCSAPLCSVGLGLAGAFALAARALSASLRPRPGRAERKPNRPGQAKPTRRRFAGRGRGCLLCTPSPLGLAGALELATETNILRALNARVRTSMYIYIYIYTYGRVPL